MNDATYEILDRAKANVLDGERDADKAIIDAFEVETDLTWVLWELMREVFNPDDLLKGEAGESPYTDLYDYVYGEIHSDVESFIEENTWTVHYCDGPTEGDEYDSDDLTTEDEYLDSIERLTSEESGWTIIDRYDKEVWLREPEEKED